MVGEYGVPRDVQEDLQRRLEGSTLVWTPV
jgi:hypothetical protein